MTTISNYQGFPSVVNQKYDPSHFLNLGWIRTAFYYLQLCAQKTYQIGPEAQGKSG